MRKFLSARIGQEEYQVDPDDYVMNAALTNMTVACYSRRKLNQGNSRPEYVNYLKLEFSKEDFETIKKAFQLNKSDTERKRIEARTKAQIKKKKSWAA